MKTIVIISIGTIVSGLIIVQVLFLLYANKPELFTAANNSLATDSLQQIAAHDSLITSSLENHTDSLVAEKSVEVKPTEQSEEKQNKDSEVIEEKKEESKIVLPVAVADSVDVKAQAKMLEAMGVEGAAKIMSTMNDKEVKAILPKMKKRTAAKILVSFDPNRAARLLR